MAHRCCEGGALLSPLLKTQMENEDGEREEEEDPCDEEHGVDRGARFGQVADGAIRVVLVGGGKVRMKNGVIERRRVYGHLEEEKQDKQTETTDLLDLLYFYENKDDPSSAVLRWLLCGERRCLISDRI